jgi:WD40 repeat protein
VVSGAKDGGIIVWWAQTGEMLRRIQAHKGAVRCLAFDATRIISGGSDAALKIIDITTGDLIQELRGHTKPVLALAFDATYILSASPDNTYVTDALVPTTDYVRSFKYWKWGSVTAQNDRYHVLDEGETVAVIAKMYHTSVQDILRWNGSTDPRDTYVGQRLLVEKADPNALTQAEIVSVCAA